MAKPEAPELTIDQPAIHPEAAEHFLPSGLVLRERPLSGDTYLKYQGKVIGFSVKQGTGGFSIPNQWLATQALEVVKDGEAKALDLATLTMGLDFDDAARVNSILNAMLSPVEPEEGLLPSGATLTRTKLKAQDYWAYQDKIGASLDRKTGSVANGDALVAANVALATKMFEVDGVQLTEGWLRSASFADAAYILGEVGKRISATQAP